MNISDRVGHFLVCGIFGKFSKHEMYIFKFCMVSLKFKTQALLQMKLAIKLQTDFSSDRGSLSVVYFLLECGQSAFGQC